MLLAETTKMEVRGRFAVFTLQYPFSNPGRSTAQNLEN